MPGKLILFLVAAHGGRAPCSISVDALAELCSCSRATIKRTVSALRRERLLSVMRREGTTNYYQLGAGLAMRLRRKK